jgi:hypothetical protein
VQSVGYPRRLFLTLRYYQLCQPGVESSIRSLPPLFTTSDPLKERSGDNESKDDFKVKSLIDTTTTTTPIITAVKRLSLSIVCVVEDRDDDNVVTSDGNLSFQKKSSQSVANCLFFAGTDGRLACFHSVRTDRGSGGGDWSSINEADKAVAVAVVVVTLCSRLV